MSGRLIGRTTGSGPVNLGSSPSPTTRIRIIFTAIEMLEKEIWGELTVKEFQEGLTLLSKKFGNPNEKRRLSIEVSDWDNQSLSTRIRVTDGEVELMQKVGDWNSEAREEIAVILEGKATTVHNVYRMLINLSSGGNLNTYLMQHHNYVWDTPEYEIKLSHQTGKSDKYNFEIEARNNDLDIISVAKELNLRPDLSEKGPDFWAKWNEAVNLDPQELPEGGLLKLLESSLQN